MQPYIFKTKDYGKTWEKITNGLPANMYNRCVRNDPNVQGILYAGLETGVWFSLNDGGFWQPLQLNLPVAPVTDIRIQATERDIVIATHGRSFWILDDISPLYDLAKNGDAIQKSNAYLYPVNTAHRTPGPSYYSEVASDQTGENEAVGVKVRYYVKQKSEKELRLAFYESDGDLIITYSNLYDKKRTPITIKDEFYPNPKVTESGKLNAFPGSHQFVWDMRYPDAKGDTSATFEASLMGPLAVPGNYLVKMFIGDSLVGQQTFVIARDPRNPATQQDLQAQFDMNQRICAKLNQIYVATASIRETRDMINEHMGEGVSEDIKNNGKKLIDALTAIEGELYNPKILAYEDNLKFPIMLEEKLAGLNYFLQMADTAPTKSMYAKYDDLNVRIDVQLNALKQLMDDEVKAFKQQVGE